jgi:hypothetical protein
MPIHIGENFYDSGNAERRIVPYPASLWPVSGLDSPPVGDSIAIGADNLDAAIRNTPGPVVVPALSQGSMVVDAEKARLARDPHAPAPDRLRFIQTGDPNNVARAMFPAGTYLPVLDYTVPGAVDSQYDTTFVKAQYDMWADPPDRMDNLLAVANAVFGGQFLHTETAFANPADVAPENITTYFLPAAQLPLTKPLRDMGWSPQVVDQLDAVLRPQIDSAYYRNNPPTGPAVPPPAPAGPVIKLNATDQANVDNAVRQVQQVRLSPADQANVDNAVKGVKLNQTEQANLDQAVQQVKNLLPPGF